MSVAAAVLFAHYWADLAGSCICGWTPDGPRRTNRREHAEHVAQQLAAACLLAPEKTP